MIAASVKPCIVNVLHIPFQNTPEPGALDLYFTVLVYLPNAGAISTSAEFLFHSKNGVNGYTIFLIFDPKDRWLGARRF